MRRVTGHVVLARFLLSGLGVNQAFDVTISRERNNEALLCQNGRMNRARRAPLLFTTVVLILCGFQTGAGVFATSNAGPGLIKGTVYYEDGKPVNGATVYVVPADRGVHWS